MGFFLPMQTWPEGRENDFPSYCGLPQSQYASMTITNITIPDANLQWVTRAAWYRDHSKWAVSAAQNLVYPLRLQEEIPAYLQSQYFADLDFFQFLLF